MDTVIDHRSAHELADHFKAISKVIPLKPVRSDADYASAVLSLNALLDADAGDEDHVLADLAATLDELIADYDDRHHHLPVAGPVELLRFLMNEHDLKQTDLAAEVGSQGVVSEILHGKRALNLRQMRALAQRFGVPVAAFVDAAQDVAA